MADESTTTAMTKRQVSDQALTISEVAKATGVSAMTVSRVLNGRPDVAAATREPQPVADLGPLC